MANFVAIAQRIFEEHCVERGMMLVEVLRAFNIQSPVRPNDVRDFVNKSGARRGEGDACSGRTRAGILKNIKEIRPDATVAPRVAITHDSRRRWLRTEERHQGIVERPHRIRVANPQINVTE